MKKFLNKDITNVKKPNTKSLNILKHGADSCERKIYYRYHRKIAANG